MRDDFSAKTKNALYSRVNFHCSNPDCKIHTSGWHTDNKKAAIIGVAAHITAAAEGGPRYDPNLSSEKRKSPENGIWLCANCAKLIDSDVERFPVELLLKWKVLAEKDQQIIEERQDITETLVDGYLCGHCNDFVKDGLFVCKGCRATVIYGQAQREKENSLKTGAGAGALIALFILLRMPAQLNEWFSWSIPQYFGLGIHCATVVGVFVFSGAVIVYQIAERYRRSQPPRFFRFQPY